MKTTLFILLLLLLLCGCGASKKAVTKDETKEQELSEVLEHKKSDLSKIKDTDNQIIEIETEDERVEIIAERIDYNSVSGDFTAVGKVRVVSNKKKDRRLEDNTKTKEIKIIEEGFFRLENKDKTAEVLRYDYKKERSGSWFIKWIYLFFILLLIYSMYRLNKFRGGRDM